MSMTLFSKSANSFSLFERKSNPTLAEYTKAKQNIQEKIDKVENTLQIYIKNQFMPGSQIKPESKYNSFTQVIREKLNNNTLIAKVLKKISNHNKLNNINSTISKLSNSLDKYRVQNNFLEKKIEESQLLALKNMEILIEHFNDTPENLKKEGLFRISPSQNALDSIVKVMSKGDEKEIKKEFNKNNDPHVIIGAIKQQFKLALSNNEKININELVINFSNPRNNNPLPLLNNLPPAIQKIMPLLAKIKEEKSNQMNENNLAICLAPNMMLDSYNNPQEAVKKYNLLLKCLIQKAGTPPIAMPRTHLSESNA